MDMYAFMVAAGYTHLFHNPGVAADENDAFDRTDARIKVINNVAVDNDRLEFAFNAVPAPEVRPGADLTLVLFCPGGEIGAGPQPLREIEEPQHWERVSPRTDPSGGPPTAEPPTDMTDSSGDGGGGRGAHGNERPARTRPPPESVEFDKPIKWTAGAGSKTLGAVGVAFPCKSLQKLDSSNISLIF